MAEYDITNLTGTPGNIINLLTWTSPTSFTWGPITYNFEYVHVRYAMDAPPSNRSKGNWLTNVSGSGDVYTVHNNIINETSYYYSLFSVYQASSPPGAPPIYYGPYSIGPLTPVSGAQFFTDVRTSFSKLEANTRLYDRAEKIYTTDLIIWLPAGQEQRKQAIIQSLNKIKPAHTEIRVFWESYYVAHTTTEQFASASFDPDVYEVRNGTLINKVPTIDASFGGDISI